MKRQMREQDPGPRLDKITQHVANAVLSLDDEIRAMQYEMDSLKKQANKIKKAWEKEHPWELAGVLSKADIEFLSEYGGYGADLEEELSSKGR